ncbi:MAG TPA: energy transducer TonB [Blastocatellia bacterium]|nr:energy transducer TonB [Blastocatellia bacterium]
MTTKIWITTLLIILTAPFSPGQSASSSSQADNKDAKQLGNYSEGKSDFAAAKIYNEAETEWWAALDTKSRNIYQLSLSLRRAQEDLLSYEHRTTEALRDQRKVENEIKSLKQQIAALKTEFLALIKQGNDNGYNSPRRNSELVLIHRPKPDYPDDARRNHIAGTVVIEALFRADGRIENAKVIKKVGYFLDENSLKAVNQAIFVPKLIDGRFAAEMAKVSLHFDFSGGYDIEIHSSIRYR